VSISSCDTFNYKEFSQLWNISPGGVNGQWFGVAISANGQYQTAIAATGQSNVEAGIYISSDYGLSWMIATDTVTNDTTPNKRTWYAIAMSASGQYQTAVTTTDAAFAGYIYTSSNYGLTWTQNSNSSLGKNWYSCAVSATGQYQTAIVYYNDTTASFSLVNTTATNASTKTYGIYISNNYGATWSECTSVLNGSSNVYNPSWYSIAISSSGQYQSAVVGNPTNTSFKTSSYTITYGTYYTNCGVYVSTNYGNTWTLTTPSLNLFSNSSPSLTCIAMSASGQYQTALGGVLNTNNSSTGIYISSNYGQSWQASPNTTSITINSVSYTIDWSTVVMSSSGQYQTACSMNIGLFYSINYGQTWNGPITNWLGNPVSSTNSFTMESYLYGTITQTNGTKTATFTPNTNSKSYVTFASSTNVVGNGIPSDTTLTYNGSTYTLTFTSNTSFNGNTIGLVSINSSGGNNWSQSAMSSSGEYQTLTILNNSAYISVLSQTIKSIDNLTSKNINLIGSQTFSDGSVSMNSNSTLNYNKLSQTWTNAPGGISGLWYSASMSSAGQYQTAVSQGAGVYISSDYGVSWNIATVTNDANANGRTWYASSVSSSGQYQNAITTSDGTYNSAAQGYGYIYTSSNYGLTWNKNSSAPTKNWYSISISATGQYQTAIVYYNDTTAFNNVNVSINSVPTSSDYGIYISKDYGNSWNPCSSVSNNSIFVTNPAWYAISISATGQYQSAVIGNPTNTNYATNGSFTITYGKNYKNCGIYISGDYGNSWRLATAQCGTTGTTTDKTFYKNGTPSLTCVAISASGQYQTALGGLLNTSGFSTGIYISNNYGQTWKAVADPNVYTWVDSTTTTTYNIDWSTVSISASGQYQTACSLNLGIFYSTNYGQTWSGPIMSSTTNKFYTEACVCGSFVKDTTITSITGYSVWTFTASTTTSNSGNTYKSFTGVTSGNPTMYVTGSGIPSNSYVYSASPLKFAIPSSVTSITDSIDIYSLNAMNGNSWAQTAMSSSGEYQTLAILGDYAYTSTTPSSLKSIDSLSSTNITLNGSVTLPDNSVLTTANILPLRYQDFFLKKIKNAHMNNNFATSDKPSYTKDTTGVLTQLTTPPTYYCAMNYSGSLQIMLTNSKSGCIYYSIDFGNSWSKQGSFIGTNYVIFGVAITGNGSKLTIITDNGGTGSANQINIFNSTYNQTTNSFSTATQLVSQGFVGTSTLTTKNKIVMSNDGNYQLISFNNAILRLTLNGGKTWANVSQNSMTNVTNATSCAMSYSGQYMVCLTSSGITNSQGGYFYKSSDYGTTWKNISISSSNAPTTGYDIAISSTGQYITVLTNCGIYVSSSYGEQWTCSSDKTTTTQTLWQNIVMTSSGNYQIASFSASATSAAVSYVTSSSAKDTAGGIILSNDYGNTWTKYYTFNAFTNTSNMALSSSGQFFLIGPTPLHTTLNTFTSSNVWISSSLSNPNVSVIPFSPTIDFAQGNHIAIGYNSGLLNQDEGCIAIGWEAGENNQSQYSVAIGNNAGQESQKQHSVAIGNSAGQTNQGSGAVAIGTDAAYNNQGTNSIAIGYKAGSILCHDHSIILNATGDDLSSPWDEGFFVAPLNSDSIATYDGATFASLAYDIANKEIIYNTKPKTFIIDHPIDKTRHLVHACLEGPESGVYYRGKGEITNNEFVTIILPNYITAFANELTNYVTAIYDGKVKSFAVSDIDKTGKFNVYGENGKFNWVVFGKRGSINIEPLKSETNVKGFGPYNWTE